MYILKTCYCYYYYGIMDCYCYYEIAAYIIL